MPHLLDETRCYIPESDIDASLEKLRRRKKDISRYSDIMAMSENPLDPVFQRKFCGSYRVRRNAAWRAEYFRLMDAYRKQGTVSFEEILRRIYRTTGRVEASFSSKMFATLDPDMPIWDRLVLSALHFHLSGGDPEKKLSEAVELYAKICSWYKAFLQTETANDWIRRFDCAFPEFSAFSTTKKIDFILWASS